MDYVYDILINLNSSKTYEFYEWRDSDNLYHIRKAPLIKVSDKQFLDIKYNNILISKNILEKIKKKTEVYQDLNVYYINYLCVFACDLDIIVIEFNKDGYSINKSNMLLEEADDTLYETSELDCEVIEYTIIKKDYIYDVDNTRHENEIKKYINKEINKAIKFCEYNKLKYLYYEWFNKKNDDINTIIKDMKKIFNTDYSAKHESLAKVIKLSNTSI